MQKTRSACVRDILGVPTRYTAGTCCWYTLNATTVSQARETVIGGAVTLWSHLKDTVDVPVWDTARELVGKL